MISTKWYAEQVLLTRCEMTLGIVTGVSEMGRRRSIRYEFKDGKGDYRGGIQRDFLRRQMDQVVIVVYDRSNPDHNCSSRGFMFRSLRFYPLERSSETP